MSFFSKAIFAERLRAERGNRSQSQMAELLGMKQPMYARYESGATLPSAELLFNICQKLEVSADWLLGLDQASGHGGSVNTEKKKGKAS
jgi:transcriptional regulator with XRE-family HTH domain